MNCLALVWLTKIFPQFIVIWQPMNLWKVLSHEKYVLCQYISIDHFGHVNMLDLMIEICLIFFLLQKFKNKSPRLLFRTRIINNLNVSTNYSPVAIVSVVVNVNVVVGVVIHLSG
jgi:hypothetical protein